VSTTRNVEGLVEASGLRPIAIRRKGEPRVAGASRLWRTSGFNVDVSSVDGAIEKQVRDAIRFLRGNSIGLRRLRRRKNFGGMVLDFGLYDAATEDRPWPSYRLPAILVELAGKLGIEIELSFYGSEPNEAGKTGA
jgi:hypothetical protein